MLSKRLLATVVLFAVQLIIFSCKKKEKNVDRNQGITKRIEFKIVFPDTVYVDKLYDGVIKYKSDLDTITTSFDDKKKKRYPIFYLTIVNKPDPDYRHLKKVAKKFGAHDIREIPFYGIKFTKIGINYIDGIINDFVVIDENKKNKDGLSLLREIENEERVTKKVIVINDPKHKSK